MPPSAVPRRAGAAEAVPAPPPAPARPRAARLAPRFPAAFFAAGFARFEAPPSAPSSRSFAVFLAPPFFRVAILLSLRCFHRRRGCGRCRGLLVHGGLRRRRRMAAEQPRRRELAKLVAHHVLRHVD